MGQGAGAKGFDWIARGRADAGTDPIPASLLAPDRAFQNCGQQLKGGPTAPLQQRFNKRAGGSVFRSFARLQS